MESQTLGWGIVGLGRIASSQIAPAITASQRSTLVSVVSRDQRRATQFARAHDAANALDDYAAMLADPPVGAVYIATPNALHAEQVAAAAKAGKHVLCDKAGLEGDTEPYPGRAAFVQAALRVADGHR